MMPHIYFKNERCTLMSIFEYFFMKRTEITVVGNCYMQQRGTYKSVTDDRNWEQKTYFRTENSFAPIRTWKSQGAETFTVAFYDINSETEQCGTFLIQIIKNKVL